MNKRKDVCCKCGCTDVYVQYRPAGSYIDVSVGGMRKGKTDKELLFIHCRTCGYSWTSDTKEQKEERKVESIVIIKVKDLTDEDREFLLKFTEAVNQ